MFMGGTVEAALGAVGSGGTGEGSFGVLLAYVLLSLVVSSLCSFLESVLLSVTLGHAKVLVEQGRRGAQLLERMKSDPERPLTVILTLNTVAHTMGAVGVGNEVGKLYGEAWLTAASVVMTLAVLLFSEIIPKTLGALYWKRTAVPVAQLTEGLTWLLIFMVWPIMWMRRIFPASTQTSVTREELRVLAGVGEDEGELEEDEERVIDNLLRLGSVTVADVMTPRVVMTAFPATMTVAEVISTYSELPHARIPIFGETLDDVRGLVLRARVLRAAINGRDTLTMGELAAPIQTCDPGDDLDSVLDRLLNATSHLMVVTDEYGGTAGIVTLEDVLEQLLGVEIVDESDPYPDMRELARGRHHEATHPSHDE